MSYTKSKRMATRHLEQKSREKLFLSRDRLGEKPSLFSLQSKEKDRGKKETAINGSPKVNVPEDKLSFKHDPGKKKKGETKDREVRHPRDTHQAIRMIQSELPATRLVSSSNKESGTKRRHVSACILPNASTTEKAIVTTAKRVCSFIPRRKIKATTERQRLLSPLLFAMREETPRKK